MNAKKTKTVSLPEELLNLGLELARRDNRSFSSYVQRLIQRDANGELPVETALQAAAGAEKEKVAA